MIDIGSAGLVLALFAPCLALTLGAFWLAVRLTPWFMRERLEPPTVRSFFLDVGADADVTQAQMTTVLIAAAILLAVLIPVVGLIRFGGFAL